MNMLHWAKNEIAIAIKKCKRDYLVGKTSSIDDYYIMCCKSALKAYKTLLKDRHSGSSINITMSILKRLVNCKPLSLIEDIDSEWNLINEKYDSNNMLEYLEYQSTRMSSLFKTVFEDGRVLYHDVNRFVVYDITNNDTYGNCFISRFMHELLPVTMPYDPYTSPITVNVKTYNVKNVYGYSTDEYNCNVLHIVDCVLPTDEKTEVKVNRYFMYTKNGFVRISSGKFKELTK